MLKLVSIAETLTGRHQVLRTTCRFLPRLTTRRGGPQTYNILVQQHFLFKNQFAIKQTMQYWYIQWVQKNVTPVFIDDVHFNIPKYMY